jgi:hypothetical protein
LEITEVESPKLVEPLPQEEEYSRRRSRAPSEMRLSSTQSFSTSPQADLAASPSLKRAVRRTRPMLKPLPTPTTDDEEDDDLVIGRLSLIKQEAEEEEEGDADSLLSIAKKPEVSSMPPHPVRASAESVLEGKKKFGSLAKQYYNWVAEALEDISFREFGQTVDEVKSFKEMLEESDKDIAEPSLAQYNDVVRSWKDLVVLSSSTDGAEPFTSLKLDDVQELYESVLRALSARRTDYGELLEEKIRAAEQATKKMQEENEAQRKLEMKKLAEEEEEQQRERENRRILAEKKKFEEEEKQRQAVQELERKRKEEEQEAKRRFKEEQEQEAKKREEERKKSTQRGSDFDISKELMGLDFLGVVDIIPAPSASAAAVHDLDAMITSVKESSPRRDAALSPRKEQDEAIKIGDVVEAVWDQDGQWYRARIDELTDFGYWVTFVEYGNAQDTAASAVRKVSKAKAVPGESPKQTSSVNVAAGYVAGSKLVAKKQKVGPAGVVTAGPKKQPSVVVQVSSPKKTPPSQQEPAVEDVRAPVGGIAARMAMLQEQQLQQAEPSRPNRRLSGLDQRKASVKTIGTQVETELKRIIDGEDDDEDEDDGDGGRDSSPDEEEEGRLVVPVKVEQVKEPAKAPIVVEVTSKSPETRKSPDSVVVSVAPVKEAVPVKEAPVVVTTLKIESVKEASNPAPVVASKTPTSPRATEAFPVKSLRSNATKLPIVSVVAATEDTESELKLFNLREQLRKSREVTVGPTKTTARGSAVKKPEAVVAVAVVRERPTLSGINGDEPIPRLENADEVRYILVLFLFLFFCFFFIILLDFGCCDFGAHADGSSQRAFGCSRGCGARQEETRSNDEFYPE